jgi:tetratricopeptide (TPR) repeat protein
VNLGLAYLSVGRWQDAVESFRTAVELNPTGSAVRSFLGTAMLYTGEAEGGLAAIEDEPDEVSRLLAASMAYHALDRAEESDSTLAELIDKYEELVAYNIAYVVAYRGEIDRAFEWLDRAVLYEDPGLSEIFIRPEFAVLHDDPRWLPFLESIGKSPAQLAAIEFGVTLPQ